MAEPSRIVIAGAATGAHWNAGDEAIFVAMIAELRAAIPGLSIDVISANPPGTIARHGVAEIRYDEIGRIVDAASNANLVIIGGGGLFFDYWGFPAGEILTPRHAGLSFYTGIAVLATLLRKPLMMYGVGVGPLQSDEGRTFTRVAFEQADAISVRDAQSSALLISLGIDRKRINVVSDPAFALQPAAPPSPPPKLAGAPRPWLMLAMRQWDETEADGEWTGEVAAAVDDFIERNGGTAIFVPFHKTVGEVSDAKTSRRIIDAMRKSSDAIEIGEEQTAEDLAALIGQADIVAGMRLHSIVFAQLHAVPFVAISYDPKVESAVPSGLARFALPLPGLTAAALGARLDEAWRSGDEIRASLRGALAARVASAKSVARDAAALLRNAPPKAEPSAETLRFMTRVARAQLLRAAELETTIGTMRAEAAQRQQAIDWLRDEMRLRQERLDVLTHHES